MSTVRIPPVLRPHVGGNRDVPGRGATVGEVLRAVATEYSGLRDQLFDGDQLRSYVNVYLNDQDITYLQGLETPAAASDTIIILPAMAGG